MLHTKLPFLFIRFMIIFFYFLNGIGNRLNVIFWDINKVTNPQC